MSKFDVSVEEEGEEENYKKHKNFNIAVSFEHLFIK